MNDNVEAIYRIDNLQQQLEAALADIHTAEEISASLQKLLNIERTKHGMISLCNGSSSSSSSSSSRSRSRYSSSSSSWW